MNTKLTFETISPENLERYKGIVDSILYICEYSGFSRNDVDLMKEIVEPDLPKNGTKDNNRILGVSLTASGDPVAWVQYYVRFNSNDTVFLGELYVSASQHGKGIGSQILRELESKWLLQGMKKVVLNVDLKNWGAIQFWIGRGFVTIEKYLGDKAFSCDSFSQLRLSKILI